MKAVFQSVRTSFLCRFVSLLTFLAFSNVYLTGQTYQIEEYAKGLVYPIGLETDSQGRLWVAEQGTGFNDSRISIVTTEGVVYPFLEGIYSEIIEGFPTGIEHLYFDINGDLLLVGTEGDTSSSILIADTSGFTPGDTPLSISDIIDEINIGDFVKSFGGEELTNPYTLTIGPNDDWFIVDASFNGIIRRERTTGNLSVFTQWANVVPTGSAFINDKFYVGTLTAFPFTTGSALIYEIDTLGNSTNYQTGLTTIMDLKIDPKDSSIVFLQFARFNNVFQSNSGGVFKIKNGEIDTIAYPVNYPAGLCFNDNGDLFVSSYYGGIIYKITQAPTDVKTSTKNLQSFELSQNYPNPFNPTTQIKFSIPKSSFVNLKVYDILGKEVATLLNEEKQPGNYEIQFDASALSSGVYFYKLTAGNFIETKKMILLR